MTGAEDGAVVHGVHGSTHRGGRSVDTDRPPAEEPGPLAGGRRFL